MKTSPRFAYSFSFVLAATLFFGFGIQTASAACDWVITGGKSAPWCADVVDVPECSSATNGTVTQGHFKWGDPCNATYTCSCSTPTCTAPQVFDGTSCVSPISVSCNVNGTPSTISLTTADPVTYNYSISGNATACFEYGSGNSEPSSSGAHSISYGTLPAGNYTRGVSCGNAAGPVDCFVNVNVLPPSPTVSVSVSPSHVAAGSGSFTVSMSSTNATSCTWSRTSSYGGDWTNQSVGATSLNVTATGWPAGQASYSFTCTNASGSASGSGSVTVSGATIQDASCTIQAGQSSCSAPVVWTSSYTTGTQTIRRAYDGGSIFATVSGTSGTQAASWQPAGTYTLDFYDGSLYLTSGTFTITATPTVNIQFQ